MNLVHLDIILFSIWLVIFGWYELIMRKHRDKSEKFSGHWIFFILHRVLFVSCFYHGIWFFLALILMWRFSLPEWIAVPLAGPGMIPIALVFFRWWIRHVEKLTGLSPFWFLGKVEKN